MSPTFLESYAAYLQTRKESARFRVISPSEILSDGRIARAGRVYVNFSGNDYLGLSRHPALIEAAREAAARYGAGSTASRLIAGDCPLYGRLEEIVARGKRQEAALILSSGYQANLTILAALADRQTLGRPAALIADRLAHHSILQAAPLAEARLMRFRHNDWSHLRECLRKADHLGLAAIVATESVFGMDGDRADLAEIAACAEEAGAASYVDEAHATGLYGPDGYGETAAVAGRIDVAMGTFGKALGSFGSYVACSRLTRDYLIQRCGGLIYSTALPPAVLGAMIAAWELSPGLCSERARLARYAARVRGDLKRQGWECGAGDAHIVPILVGAESRALRIAAILEEKGYFAPAIRPPTVPAGASRLRVSLSAAHQEEDIEGFLAAMEDVAGREAAEI